MDKVKFKFGKREYVLKNTVDGYFLSRPNKDNIVYIVNSETALTGVGKTYAIELSEHDDYDTIVKQTIATIEYMEKQ